MSKTQVPLESILLNWEHPDYKVRSEAVKALGQSKDPEAIYYLIRALQDNAVTVKRQTIRSLGRLKDERCIEPLIALLDDHNCNIHRPASEILIGFKKRAILPLIQALQHERAGIRMMAAYCLGEIRDSAACMPLVSSLHDPAEPVAVSAARALQLLKAECAREPLAALIGEDGVSQAVKTNAALALAFLSDSRAIEILDAAYDRLPGNVVWISAALGHIHDERVIPVLKKIGASSSKVAQDCAHQALLQLGFVDIR